MNLDQFHHLCRAASALTGEREILVFGAAAATPWLADAPWRSLELDISMPTEELAVLVAGALGAGSIFQATFGIEADGVTPDGFIAPPDWRKRAKRIPLMEEEGGIVVVPHPHDLLVSKLARGEEKDIAFARFVLGRMPIPAKSLRSLVEAAVGAHPAYAKALRMNLARLMRSAQDDFSDISGRFRPSAHKGAKRHDAAFAEATRKRKTRPR